MNIKYFSFPFFSWSIKQFQKELTHILNKLYSYLVIKLIFYIHIKLALSRPACVRSHLVYYYNYPNCALGTSSYICYTQTNLNARIDGHRAFSHIIETILSNQVKSSIRNHCNSCEYNINYKDFKIPKICIPNSLNS